MSENDDGAGAGQVHAWWQPAALLTPASAAVAALAVAATTLSGQNLLLVGVQSLLGQGFGSGSSPAGYYVVWGISALVPLALVVLLARVALRASSSGWESVLARAAMLLAAATAAGAILTALGGVLHDGFLGI
jgi:hypothetical protein